MVFKPRRLLGHGSALALALSVVTCTDNTAPTTVETPTPDTPRLYRTPTGLVSATAPEIFVGAGDIASCSKTGDSETAALLDNIPGKVFLLGDNVYENGTTSEFANCFHPTWGRHKDRSYPSAGNHEYNTSGAAPYYAYFGAAAGDPNKGYYSFNLGAWHVVVLNSNISRSTTSPQIQWLRADLAANQNLCTIAYFHHPLYSSTGGTGSGGATYSSVRTFYDELYAAGAELALAGHRHFYERLAKMRPDGSADPVNGTRHIIVGTGGIGGGTLSNLHPRSEVRNGDTRGVLKLYLYEDSYAWKFIPVAGKTFSDSGSNACHGPSQGGGSTVSASQSTVTAASPITASNGSSTSTITVTARNSSGSPVSGATVLLSATGAGNTVTQPTGTTNSSGVATGTLSSTVAGAKTVSATINGVSINQQPSVTVDPAAATALAFSVQPTNTDRNVAMSPAPAVQIRDQYGNVVTGAANSVTIGLGNNPGGGTLSGTTTRAAVNGTATFTGLSINNAGTGYTLVATASGLSDATSNGFNITAPAPTVSASNSTVVADPTSIAAGASSTITVTVKDGSDAAMSGVTVTFSAAGGGSFGQPSATSDANGLATNTFTSTTTGSKTITAVAGGVTLNQKPVVDVTPGPPDAGQSTVTASPTTVQTGANSTVTVTVKDAHGNRVSGATVTLSASPAGATLGQPGSTTNSNGVATGTLSSPDPGQWQVSAEASISGNTTQIAQTATVNVSNNSIGTIEPTLLTTGFNTTNTKVYTTASVSPAPNSLVTVAVLGHRSQTPSPTPTISGGGLSGWTEVASVTYAPLSAPLKRLTVFRAMSSTPGSGPITITFPATVSNAQWIVTQWTGVDQSGSNGSGAIVQTGSVVADAVNGLAVTLNPFSHPNNVALGIFAATSSSSAISPGAGFTEIAEQASNESQANTGQMEWAVNRSTIDATWNNLQGGAIGIEIRAGP